MYAIFLAVSSDLHPNDRHLVSEGRTLAIALARARPRLATYGAVVAPGRLFYMKGDGVRRPLV